jgi:hypothetical protein
VALAVSIARTDSCPAIVSRRLFCGGRRTRPGVVLCQHIHKPVKMGVPTVLDPRMHMTAYWSVLGRGVKAKWREDLWICLFKQFDVLSRPE